MIEKKAIHYYIIAYYIKIIYYVVFKISNKNFKKIKFVNFFESKL